MSRHAAPFTLAARNADAWARLLPGRHVDAAAWDVLLLARKAKSWLATLVR